MKQFKISFSLIALVLAFVTASAFTHAPVKAATTEVWFSVDASGQALDPSDGIADQIPANCTGGSNKCARALHLNQVTSNGDGTYSINSGVDITTAYVDEAFKM